MAPAIISPGIHTPAMGCAAPRGGTPPNAGHAQDLEGADKKDHAVCLALNFLTLSRFWVLTRAFIWDWVNPNVGLPRRLREIFFFCAMKREYSDLWSLR